MTTLLKSPAWWALCCFFLSLFLVCVTQYLELKSLAFVFCAILAAVNSFFRQPGSAYIGATNTLEVFFLKCTVQIYICLLTYFQRLAESQICTYWFYSGTQYLLGTFQGWLLDPHGGLSLWGGTGCNAPWWYGMESIGFRQTFSQFIRENTLAVSSFIRLWALKFSYLIAVAVVCCAWRAAA